MFISCKSGCCRRSAGSIHTDAAIYAGIFVDGESVTYQLQPSRHGYVQVVQGAVQVGGHALKAGDGVAVSGEPSVTIVGQGRGEVLLFDLP